MSIRRPTIVQWLRQKEYMDNRGWSSGRKRTHTDAEEQRIVSLKKKRTKDKKYFHGREHIQMDYAEAYPNDPVPSTWFIRDVIARHALQTQVPSARQHQQNIVDRLLFPAQSIRALGTIHQAGDFIGKKFITGSPDPISFFSTSYYQELALHHVWRILAEKADYATQCLTAWWRQYPIADVFRIDNGTPFRGPVKAEAHIGRFVKFLLNMGVAPLFSAQYQSYTNPHIEGHNSTFAAKVWRTQHFTTHAQIDRECDRFNAESAEFFRWKFKERLAGNDLRFLTDEDVIDLDVLRSTKGKKVHFIRFVEQWKMNNDVAGIVVLNRFIELPDPYRSQYVFATLDLDTAQLRIVSERNGRCHEIYRKPYEFIC